MAADDCTKPLILPISVFHWDCIQLLYSAETFSFLNSREGAGVFNRVLRLIAYLMMPVSMLQYGFQSLHICSPSCVWRTPWWFSPPSIQTTNQQSCASESNHQLDIPWAHRFSFMLHLQLRLLRHFQKSVPPRELHPPEDEPMEESKEAHCFCSGRLEPCCVTRGRKKKWYWNQS